MSSRVFVLCLACLFATPVAAAERGNCLASPDYSCLVGYALATAERIEDADIKTWALACIAAAVARRK